VFFSSHILEQVEAVCDRVGILREGELVAVDSIDGLRAASDADATLRITVGAAVDDDLLATLRDLTGVDSVDRDGDDALRVACDSDAKTTVVTTLEDGGVPVDDFSTQEASLEDLFLAYTETDGTRGASDGGADREDAPDHEPEAGDAGNAGNAEVPR
jgi:ABC-2 type transport system ATP-binding protein